MAAAGTPKQPRRQVHEPSLADAIIPLVTLAVLIAGSLLFGLDALNGGIQILSPSWCYAAAVLICGVIAMVIGQSWPPWVSARIEVRS
jgi:Na+:H+ antiporter, NhaC family